MSSHATSIDPGDEIFQDFVVEAGEILERLGEELIQLEDHPADAELLNAIFRGFHTIKGGAGFLGIHPLVDLCHRAEDVFNVLRQGERSVDRPVMDLMLRALDSLNDMFEVVRDGAMPSPPEASLMEAINGWLDGSESSDGPSPDPVRAAFDESTPPAPGADEPASLEGAARTPPGEALDNDISDEDFERLLDELHGEGRHGGAPAVDPTADAASAPVSPTGDGHDEDLSDAEFDRLLDSIHGAGRGPGSSPACASAAVAAEEPTAPPPAVARRDPAAAGETTVRVGTGVLDQIMNMVGELVLVRNRIATLDTAHEDEEMAKAVGNLDVVTSDLQSAVMRTRMQPIKKVFGRFPRVVRDLARSLDKEVELVMHGEDTDLDKNLVEALADPLVHLVRNSVDHGLETPAERVAAGKPRAGTVTLSAEQEGDRILLIVSDDGKGMDADVIRRKVVEKEILDEDSAARLDDGECFNLIFAPGFSTKTEISEVSGRGVGMDVVKSRIASLNGQVEVQSEFGAGTRILIRVPLTLAIVPTLMVVLGEQIFALPLVNVREIFDYRPERTNVIDGMRSVVVRGRPLPIFHLADWLVKSHPDERPGGHVVVVQAGNQIVGFVVDHLLGQEEVVIKPLGAMLQGTRGLAGATITGDGRIALILDAPGLLAGYAVPR